MINEQWTIEYFVPNTVDGPRWCWSGHNEYSPGRPLEEVLETVRRAGLKYHTYRIRNVKTNDFLMCDIL